MATAIAAMTGCDNRKEPSEAPGDKAKAKLSAPNKQAAPKKTAQVGAIVTLGWDPNPEPDIAGYHVLSRTDTEQRTQVADVSGPTATVSGLKTNTTYYFSVTAYDSGSAESAPSQELAVPIGTPPNAPPASPKGLRVETVRFANISTRGPVQTSAQPLIAGMIVDGNEPMRVVVRGIGPSLTGVGNALATPRLEVYSPTGDVLASNEGWRSGPNAKEIEAAQLAPTSDGDCALLATLPPGAYTAMLSGARGASGIGVIELYALAK